MNERQEIIERVKSGQWNHNLFEAVRKECLKLYEPCIFNVLRKILPSEQYDDFDFQCSIDARPQDKNLLLRLKAERLTKGGDIDAWTKRKKELLLKKKKLLELQKSIRN